MFPRATADLLRGCAVGATAGVLAIAGHGLGGGTTPSAASATLLAILCGISGSAARAYGRRRLTTPALVVATQLAGHFLLSAVTDAPHVHHTPLPMLAAHTAAAVACGLLIMIGDRLIAGLTALVDVVVRPLPTPPVRARAIRPTAVAAPLHSQFLGAISSRGPPVACAL